MISSYLYIAETLLYLQGPNFQTMKDFAQDATVIAKTMPHQDTVMKSWPIYRSE